MPRMPAASRSASSPKASWKTSARRIAGSQGHGVKERRTAISGSPATDVALRRRFVSDEQSRYEESSSMNHHGVKALTIAAGTLLAVALVSAQPPASATYDRERKVTLQGAVTRIEWVNPNAFV